MTNSPWFNASYLIEAKKDIDSLIYIDQNLTEFSEICIKEYAESKRSNFYINLCKLIDKVCKDEKAYLKKNNPEIKSVLEKRNKKYAHDDESFKPDDYTSLQNMIECMKNEINAVKIACAKGLPANITLDYVPHDRLLFRQIHKINSKDEDEIDNVKYPLKNKLTGVGGATIKSFNNPQQIRSIPKEERSLYGVIVENGINEYEGLQNRQDFCINSNVLFETDLWCSMDVEISNLFSKLRKIGFIDDYNVIQVDSLSNEDLLEVQKLFSEYEGHHK